MNTYEQLREMAKWSKLAPDERETLMLAAKQHAAMLDALRKAADRLAICCELQPDQKERDTIWAWVEEARTALPRGTP